MNLLFDNANADRQERIPGLSVFLPILLLLGMAIPASAQICDGNVGENIFTEGDFGSGLANIPWTDPQIAPGYIYTTQPPPNDGYYTITNNIAFWPSAFGWVEIGDNSNDLQGYMMVVNASYTPGLFYEQQVEGLCDNTLYLFSADIFNLIHSGSNVIKPNVSFLIDGNVVYSTGEIPENQQWNTYGFTFSTEPGQTSVTLALRNNAPGGIGNDLALDNITFRPCGPEALILPDEIANICEDGTPIDLEATIVGNQYDTPVFQWQQSFDEGQTWVDIPGATNATYTHTDLSAGYYYYRYLLANGSSNLLNPYCRVVSNVKIVYVVPKFYTIVDTLCEGLSFSFGNHFYSGTGIYVDSLLTYLGCDSIVTLDLTFIPDEGIDATFDLTSPSCTGFQDGSISVDTILNGTKPYSIFIDDVSNANGSLSQLPGGDYSFVIEDRYGCRFETTVNLEDPPPFLIDLGPDWSVDLGESITLHPFFSEPAGNFLWQPADLIDCNPGCETASWTPVDSTLVSLTATATATGCIASDAIFVNVDHARKVYIPNTFSPNFDGINDYFAIFGAIPNVQRIEELVIFDRWGELVFERKNMLPNQSTLGWDGTFEGKPLPEGVYLYFAKIRFLDNEVISYFGDISIIK
ncbi:MAG: gliding motility-associated C-terminal domain-containing protein [Lewinellaceae bacterium]|nr:gliding motility-associated C-terminal domain-containing protein [Lewinellaceae bacterium]